VDYGTVILAAATFGMGFICAWAAREHVDRLNQPTPHWLPDDRDLGPILDQLTDIAYESVTGDNPYQQLADEQDTP
jgi:hypothetical protein